MNNVQAVKANKRALKDEIEKVSRIIAGLKVRLEEAEMDRACLRHELEQLGK